MSEKNQNDHQPAQNTDELADELLEEVAGGADFNPQPEPPGDMRRGPRVNS